MSVDVVDIRRRHVGPAQRSFHAAQRAVAILGRRGDVVGVAG